MSTHTTDPAVIDPEIAAADAKDAARYRLTAAVDVLMAKEGRCAS